MQHALVALQQEKSSSSSILIFVISLLGCPGPSIRSPPPLCTPLVAWHYYYCATITKCPQPSTI